MARLATLICGLLAPCGVLWAQGEPAAPGPAEVRRWYVSENGREVGWERVELRRAAGAWTLSSRAELRLTETPFRYRQELRLRGAKLERYSLRAGAIEAAAEPQGEGVRLSASYGEGRAGEKLVARGKLPQVVLDTQVRAHFEVLAALARKQAGPFELEVLVPQTLNALRTRFEPGRSFQVQLGGRTRRVREGVLRLGQRALTLTYDRDRDAAYRVVDDQGYSAAVSGWPGLFVELELQLTGAAEEQIPATLTLPRQDEPAPGLVFVGDLDARGRDALAGKRRPLRDLARDLAARGVASLRYDAWSYRLKRALASGAPARVAAARERWREGLLAERDLADARAALASLAARGEVGALGLVGHGTGARSAAALAAVDSRVAALVSLAGVAGGADTRVIAEQAGRLAPARREEALKQFRALFARVRGGKIAPDLNVFGYTARSWQDLLARPTLPTLLERGGPPVLALRGEADEWVSAADQEAIAAALRGREDGSRHALLPGLDHAFSDSEGRVPQAVSQEIAAWLRERLR